MIINKPKDLVYPIELLIDSNGYKIRVQDCNKFSCKFFTTNEDNYIESSFIDGELTNLVINEDEDLALINSSDLSNIENGTIKALIQYSIEDVNYEDGMFDNNMYQTTNFILAIKSIDGSTGDTYTKFEIDSKLKKKLDTEVYNQDKETFANKEELSTKQDVLISGESIKTINGNSILGEGDITIEVSGGISDVPNDGKKYVRQNQNWVEETVIDTSSFATKSEIPTNVSQLTNDSGYLTSIPTEYITEEELASKDYATNTSLATKLDVITYNEDKVNFATKSEIPTNVSQLTNDSGYLTEIPTEYVTEEELTSKDYATNASLSAKLDVTTYNEDKVNFATKDEIPEEYQLPIASTEILGGIKVGAGLTIGEDGLLSANGGGVADSVEWENVQNKPTFATVATSGSYNDLKDKPTIPTKVSELTNDSNYITNLEVDGKLATKVDVEIYNDDKANFASKDELGNYLTIENAASTYQPKGEYLTSIPTEYITEEELASKDYATNTSLSAKLDVTTYNDDKANFASKDELGNYLTTENAALTYQPKGEYLTEIPSEYITETELNSSISGKQDTLISGTNIKTINGNSILGEGDITIEVSGGISDAPNDGKKYVRQNQNWVEETVIDTSSFATKSEIPTNVSQLTNDSGYLTSIPTEYVTEEELTSKDYATNASLSAKLDVTTYNDDKANFASKDELGNYATNETVNGIEARLQTVETELSGATEITNNILQMI